MLLDKTVQSELLPLHTKRVLALSALPRFGLKKFYQLMDWFGSLEALWVSSYIDIREAGLSSELSRSVADLVQRAEDPGLPGKVEEWLQQDNCSLLSTEDEFYPEILKQIYCPPPYLYVKGCLRALKPQSIAIVGSRKASVQGLQHAFDFSREFALQGLTVVSGLALGIDASAHRGALDVNGVTVGVLATGLDTIYPRMHSRMAGSILENGGALVSEMSLGTPPVPGNFPRRNRIISGLSKGVLVIEAGLKSGSLVTAGYAVEQNREVFALPGEIDNPNTKGCHSLIKQGAKLVDCVEDVLEDFGTYASAPLHLPANDEPEQALSEDEHQLVERMGYASCSFDILTERSGFTVEQLTILLIELELKGVIASVPGGYQRLKKVESIA